LTKSFASNAKAANSTRLNLGAHKPSPGRDLRQKEWLRTRHYVSADGITSQLRTQAESGPSQFDAVQPQAVPRLDNWRALKYY
jgi:hypothetical protein